MIRLRAYKQQIAHSHPGVRGNHISHFSLLTSHFLRACMVIIFLTSHFSFLISLAQPVSYTPADSTRIVSLLDEASRQPRTTNFPLFFARKFIGKPYVAHTLEVLDGEERLIVNTRQLDCTTLVENVTALTLCAYRSLYTFRDYLNALMSLRYRQGRLDGYPSRLHYFTDWIVDNTRMQLVDELQQPVPPFTDLQTVHVNYMSTHPQAYKALRQHPAFVDVIRQQEDSLTGLTFRFIPKSALKTPTQAMCQAIQEGDIIAITCSKPGLDIAHLGFAVWRQDGLHLLNASQIRKKVVEEPMTMYDYMQRHPSFTGIRVIRIRK